MSELIRPNITTPQFATNITVSSVSAVTLTYASAYDQIISGSTTQTFFLPNAATLPPIINGYTWRTRFTNESTGLATIKTSGGATLTTIPSNGMGECICINNSGGTGTTAWTFFSSSNATGSATPFTGGTVTGATVFTNGLTANTMSATTYYGNGANLSGIVTNHNSLTGLQGGSSGSSQFYHLTLSEYSILSGTSFQSQINSLMYGTGVAGEALTLYDNICLKSDGMLYRANASTTATLLVVGKISAGYSSGQTVTYQKRGVFNSPSHGLTIGSTNLIYQSTSPGLSTNIKPSSSNNGVQALGYAIDSNNIELMPMMI